MSPLRRETRARMYSRKYRARHRQQGAAYKRLRKQRWYWLAVSKTQPWDL